MYCSGCGQPVAPNQLVCAYCGKQTGYPAAAATGLLPYTRVQRHIQTLSLIWIVYSIFGLVAWFVAIPFLGFFFGHAHHGFPHGDWPLPVPFGWLLPLFTLIVYLRYGLGVLVGIGLLRRERWGRTLALVISVLMLFKIPFGTALGIYTLWVLAPAESGREYDTVAAP